MFFLFSGISDSSAFYGPFESNWFFLLFPVHPKRKMDQLALQKCILDGVRMEETSKSHCFSLFRHHNNRLPFDAQVLRSCSHWHHWIWDFRPCPEPRNPSKEFGGCAFHSTFFQRLSLSVHTTLHLIIHSSTFYSLLSFISFFLPNSILSLFFLFCIFCTLLSRFLSLFSIFYTSWFIRYPGFF